jgi:hypothetical protein
MTTDFFADFPENLQYSEHVMNKDIYSSMMITVFPRIWSCAKISWPSDHPAASIFRVSPHQTLLFVLENLIYIYFFSVICVNGISLIYANFSFSWSCINWETFLAHLFLYVCDYENKVNFHCCHEFKSCILNLTNSMEQTPYWEDSSCLASQEHRCHSWIPLVHCCVHRTELHDHSPEQLNAVHALKVNFLKIHCNYILPSASTSTSHSWCQKFCMNFSSPWYVRHVALTLLKLITLTILGEKYKLWSSLLCNFLYTVKCTS